jgi:hypothetical protein
MLLGAMPFLGLVCLLGHDSKGSLALGGQDGRSTIDLDEKRNRRTLSVLIPVDAHAPRHVNVGGIIRKQTREARFCAIRGFARSSAEGVCGEESN